MVKFVLPVLVLFILACTNSRHKKKLAEKELAERQLILTQYDSFTFTPAFDDFTYIHYFDTSVKTIVVIPQPIYTKANQLFDKIGRGNVEGFTLSKDSSLRFRIRSRSNTAHLYESLYWYPSPNMIEKSNMLRKSISSRSIFKDTMLKDNWEYEIELLKKPPLF